MTDADSRSHPQTTASRISLPDRVPEERVAKILARAAELDRDARETVGLDAIRTAALEAGISMTAVDRALEEYVTTRDDRTEPVEEPGQETGRLRRLLRKLKEPFKLGLPALLVGMVAGLAGDGGEPLLVLGGIAWLVTAVRLIWRERPSRRAGGFALAFTIMTLLGILGLAMGEADEDVIAALAGFGVPLLVLGTLIIKVRLPWRRKDSAAEVPELAR